MVQVKVEPDLVILLAEVLQPFMLPARYTVEAELLS